MFSFTIKESQFLNEFLSDYKTYVSKAYKYTMKYLSNKTVCECKENERLVLIVINKSIFQNLSAFIKLNDCNMQFSAFSCLEGAVNSMRLYKVLATNSKNLHDYITNRDFELEEKEMEIKEKQDTYVAGNEEFSIVEFYKGLHSANSFKYKTSSVASQICDNNVFLGLSCGENLSEALQNEVRKNLVGAFLSLQLHTKFFFNGGLDEEFENIENEMYGKFLEYVKKFS